MMKRIRYTLSAATVLLLAAGAGWGYMQLMEVRLADVEIRGSRWSDASELEQLLMVDTTDFMYHLDPVLLADRVRRHEWVADADVARLPSGRLVVDVVEREPVALIVNAHGLPEHYVDRNGFRMPIPEGATYDVPIVRGLRDAFHPMSPLGHDALRSLLHELPVLSADLDESISEIIVDGPDVSLWMVPAAAGQAIQVSLGQHDMSRRLDVLTAFIQQESLHPPGVQVRTVDLRFENQIVVKKRE